MKRALFSIINQSVGSVLSLLLLLAIGRLHGSAVQGLYATTKAQFDLFVSIISFGFPQSFVIAINRDGQDANTLYKLSVIYCVAIASVVYSLFWLTSSAYVGGASSLLLILGAAGVALNKLARGVVLTCSNGFLFDLITIAPSVALVFSYLSTPIVTASPERSIYHIFMLSGLFCLIFSITVASLSSLKLTLPLKAPFFPNKIFFDGMDAFVQSLSITTQTYIFLSLSRHVNGDAVTGHLAMLFAAMQLFLLPMQMISPLILNNWTKSGSLIDIGRTKSLEVVLMLAAVPIITIVTFLVPRLLLLFGLSSKGYPTLTIGLFLLSVPFTLIARANILRLASLSLFRLNTYLCLARLCIAGIVLGLLILIPGLVGLSAFAASWLAGEAINALFSHVAFVRSARLTSKD